MRFWDSSALVPLCLRETPTGRLRELARGPDPLVVWWATPVECASGLARRVRDKTIAEQIRETALDRLGDIMAAAVVVAPTVELRTRAERLVRIHPLRAADALQLAAALVWVEDQPRRRELVTLDARLAEAARQEGFVVLPEALP
ncbi:MAG: PIN domain-containing protein [Gemmatimonadetes bacterium]|nr:PIN domain-containing protein [Gemmatimonadota bacterium]